MLMQVGLHCTFTHVQCVVFWNVYDLESLVHYYIIVNVIVCCCSNTSINCLPLTYGRLKNCWELIMNGLDITNVPRHLLPGRDREYMYIHVHDFK